MQPEFLPCGFEFTKVEGNVPIVQNSAFNGLSLKLKDSKIHIYIHRKTSKYPKLIYITYSNISKLHFNHLFFSMHHV